MMNKYIMFIVYSVYNIDLLIKIYIMLIFVTESQSHYENKRILLTFTTSTMTIAYFAFTATYNIATIHVHARTGLNKKVKS
jgi:hypothetical protein